MSRRLAGLPAVGKALMAVLLIAGLLGTGLFVVLRPVSAGTDALQAVYDDTRVPPTSPIPQTTFVYDRNGKLIAVLHDAVNRTPVALRRIPVTLRKAVIAAEDADFYSEGGVNFTAIARAAWVNLVRGEVVQGGSTITQQYVKDVYTSGVRTIARKVREAIIAQKLSRQLTKDQILGRYLNEVYFGHGAYGVEAAAEAYFGVDVSQLNLQQSATLAGIIAAPARFDPIRFPGAARDRRDYVLHRMAHLRMITAHKADYLESRPVKVHPAPPVPSRAPSFVNFVKGRLEGRFGVHRTFQGGLRVTTTLDLGLQRAADRAVRRHLSAPGDPSAALVAIDPHTGQVLAMVGGGKEATDTHFNLATRARRQAGSAFKPFTLATAVHQGISLLSRWSGPPHIVITDPRCRTTDPKTNVAGPWDVSNYADESAGTMTLLDATANSVNTIFSQLVLDVGPDEVAAMAHRMGIEHHLSPVCSITLGTQTVTPLDMATGYATLASQGVRHNPTGLLSVAGPSGNTVVEPTGAPARVLTKTEADLVTYALQGVVQHGTGTAAALAGRPVAGKTGTAQNFQDAWFCGYTPQLATCVWVGYPKGEIPMHDIEGFPDVFGGSVPALIWHDFMTDAMAGRQVKDFPTPDLNGYDTTPPLSVGSGTPPPSDGGKVGAPTATPTP
ncbi:MAG: transglycosylase domain-containing protein [Actinomycetota bacterium]